MHDRVAAARRLVDPARYCLDDDGQPLRQSSADEIIVRMLRLLDVRPDQGVLELGTGSGYSTALLAELTGPDGRVVSIDVDPEMTSRAASILTSVGYARVLLATGDGRLGWPAQAPFDRGIAWASATDLPRAWCEQTVPGAILVAPRHVGGESWVGSYRRSAQGELVEVERISGRFIPLTAAPFRPWEAADPDDDSSA
jgi:protein-L-isoaspartate(D-aspartate) O-methyltransferase